MCYVKMCYVTTGLMVKTQVWADLPPCCSRASSCLTLITMATDREEEREGVTAKSGWWVCNKRGEDLGVDWRVEVRLIENCNGTKKETSLLTKLSILLFLLTLFLPFLRLHHAFQFGGAVPVLAPNSLGSTANRWATAFLNTLSFLPPPQTQLTGGCFLQHLHIFARHWPLALGWRLPFCPALPHCRTTLRLVSVIQDTNKPRKTLQDFPSGSK